MDRKKPRAGQVISGTHGFFWWNNSMCYEVSSFEAKVATEREDVNFAGDMWKDSKLMAVSGTWTAKIKKIYSRGKEYAEKLANGIDVRCELIGKLADPDNGGEERIQIHSCWLDEVTLMKFENGTLTEDDFSGGFVGFDYLDSISDPLV